MVANYNHHANRIKIIMKTANNQTNLSSSQEDYLEAILALSKQQKVARVKDISEKMRVNKSSVTGALKKLAQAKLINYQPYGLITLTKTGENAAKNIANKHKLFATFLIDILHCDPSEANKVACLMEHNTSPHIIKQFQQYTNFIKSSPQREQLLKEEFSKYQAEYPTNHQEND